MSFESDLENWRRIERELAQKLVGRDIMKLEYAPKTSYKDWDLKITYEDDGKICEKTFEVKDDIISERTGNVWFEFRCFGKPSWIYASKADYIVYHLNNRFYYQERGELLYILDKVEKKAVKWWDMNQSEMYIVDKKYLNDLFKIMN